MDTNGDPPSPPSQSQPKLSLWRRLLIAMVCAPFALGLLALAIATRLNLNGKAPTSGVKVGDSHYIGARNCDKTIQSLLLDPTSYRRLSTQIIDIKPGEGWVAETTFTGGNALGGSAEGAAHCLYDGQQYRAVLLE